MPTFVDTSAIFALLDADDDNHARAAGWLSGPGRTERLVSHNYVVVESAALVQRRLGMDAARALFGAIVPLLEVTFVDATLHSAASSAWLTAAGRRKSLVDQVSFEMIKSKLVDQAFAFDEDFQSEGVNVVP